MKSKKIHIFKGTLNPNYRDGRSLKTYFCVICNKVKVSWQHFNYSTGRCRKCARKIRPVKQFIYNKCIDCNKILCKSSTRQKALRCNNCNKKFLWTNLDFRRKMQNINKKGIHNPNYKHGKKSLQKRIKENLKYISFRKYIFNRDNYICQECKQKNNNLEMHHKIKFSVIFYNFISLYKNIKNNDKLVELALEYKPFWEKNNVITLCQKCHKNTENYKTKITENELLYIKEEENAKG